MLVFDENDERERLQERLREFYEDFSAEIRNKLMSRNLRPVVNMYDVVYNNVRTQLLSKNQPNELFDKDIVERFKSIRDALVSKFVESELNIDNISEAQRKQLLSKNKLIEGGLDIDSIAAQSRKNLLSKNNSDSIDIIGLSSNVRLQNLSKNTSSISDIADESFDFRQNLLSKNNAREIDILSYSEDIRRQFREKNIHKNVDGSGDSLLDSSEEYRKNLLSKNKVDVSTDTNKIDSISQKIRNSLVSKNISGDSNLIGDSEAIRANNVSKNVDRNTNILDDSESFRQSNIHKNVNRLLGSETMLEGSEAYRNSNIHKNIAREGDLLSISSDYRDALVAKNNLSSQVEMINKFDDVRSSLLAKNIDNGVDLVMDYSDFRDSLIAKNSASRLIVDSDLIRNSQLSKNNYGAIDLEEFSLAIRDSILSKNNYSEISLDEISARIRKSMLSYNIYELIDLLDGSKSIRNGLLSKNNYEQLDLLDFSDSFRGDLIALNSYNNFDLLSSSEPIRSGLLKYNTPIDSDLLSGSIQFRQGLLSLNIGKFSDLLTDSEIFRGDLLSNNNYSTVDLLATSEGFRDNLLSKNFYSTTNLLEQSEIFRNNLLSHNTPVDFDVLDYSKNFRNDLLALNSDVDTDLLSSSINFRNDLLAQNVVNGGNLVLDSKPFRDVVLSYNSENKTNLVEYSEDFRNDVLALNASNPSNSDLLLDSEKYREGILSKNNNQEQESILEYSKSFRDNLLSKNGGGLLGLNLEAAGTSTFLGVSRVLTQGIIYRSLLLRKNKKNFQEESGRLLDDVVNNEYRDNAINKKVLGYENQRLNLQNQFGNSKVVSPTRALIGGGAAYVSTVGSMNGTSSGVYFQGNYGQTVDIWLKEGVVTSNARKMNVQKNAFILNAQRNGYQPQAIDAVSFLGSYNYGGFQELIQKTIGGFSLPRTVATNSTPLSVINDLQSTGGYYLKGGASENILKPAVDSQVGTAASMMAKTVAGNPFDEEEFKTGKRGVRYIVNKIKSSSGVADFSQNFDVQNQNVYIVGKSGDVKRKSSQRFTVANPYAPVGAQKLNFFLQNYSMSKEKQIMYFPPYVKDISIKHGANWNSIPFLGRPEPVYTYNNGSRSGSITFMVLTDYAQDVEIGVDWNTLEKINYSFDGARFTDVSRDRAKAEINFNTARINKINSEIEERRADLLLNSEGGASELESKKGEINQLVQERNSLQTKVDELRRQTKQIPFSEESNSGENVYAGASNGSNRTDGYIDTKVTETVQRLNRMKKDLMFQPAFFSGDKNDFIDRFEFLGKLTLPSENPESGGFSFIKPPVCHVHLGDIFNHDIIIDSVDFNFNDLTWSLDGGKVYPLWVTVNINFNIVGPYRHGTGTVTSSMNGGLYRDKIMDTGSEPYQEPEHF